MLAQEEISSIFLDLDMSMVDAFEVSVRIGENLEEPLRITVVTSNGSSATKRRSDELGCKVYLVKQISVDDVFCVVRDTMSINFDT